MKKILSYIIISAIMFTSFFNNGYIDIYAAKNTQISWPAASSIYGETAVLIEASTGTILYEKKCNKKMYPASITKIMTALLTIENCSLDETVTFSEKAITSLSYDDANIACQIGEKMSVKECLYALMLSSANEVATALGEHIAGSTSEFAKMMNERAKKAGAKNTNFVNANGLHDVNHYVTAYDMAMITRAAAEYPIFNEIVNSTTYTIQKNNKRKESLASYQRHKMVWPTSGYYYDGIIGGKTGFTDQAGTTLVTYAKRNGMTLIAVVLKSNSYKVYEDTATLLDYGFNNFNLVNISENDSRFNDDSSSTLKSPFSNTIDSISIDSESNVVIPKKADFTQLTTTFNFDKTKDSFATISYKYGDRTVGLAHLKYKSIDYTNIKKEDTTVASENTDNTNDSNTTTTVTDVENTNTSSISTDIKDDNLNNLDNENTNKSSFKISKLLIPIIIIIVLIILIVIITIQKRRLEKIRAQKRKRNR